MRAAGWIAGAATALAAALPIALPIALPAAPAAASDVVVVRGTGFDAGHRAELSFVGCERLYLPGQETLQPRIGRGPGKAPLGTRSLGYDLAGGNAVGALFYRESLLSTASAGLAVHAPGGSSGVAYVGYQAPEQVDTSRIWVGRALLQAPAGRWSRVEATTLRFAWSVVDMTTGAPVAAAPTGGVPRVPVSPVRDFVRTHGGDGAGFYSIGFGCDGGRFSMDAWRVGSAGDVTTYDLEGLTTATTMRSSDHRVRPEQPVTLDGSVRLGNGQRLQHGTLLLESRPLIGGRWKTVEVVDAASADPSVRVRPTESTVYRWRFVDRPLAEGSASRQVVVMVLAAPTGPPDPSDPPDPPAPSDGTGEEPDDGASDRPSDGPEDESGEAPTGGPSPSTPPSPSTGPSEPATPSDPTTTPSGLTLPTP